VKVYLCFRHTFRPIFEAWIKDTSIKSNVEHRRRDQYFTGVYTGRSDHPMWTVFFFMVYAWSVHTRIAEVIPF